MVQEWERTSPEDCFFLQLKQDSTVSDDERPTTKNICDEDFTDEDFTDEDLLGDCFTRSNTATPFLFIHQTKWQKRLLNLYGNEICLLDATYRTSRYALPVFFLCVPTNVNYMVVAEFIVENEDTESIKEALQHIRDWNPNWKPKYFMCDYSNQEIAAVEGTFHGVLLY